MTWLYAQYQYSRNIDMPAGISGTLLQQLFKSVLKTNINS